MKMVHTMTPTIYDVGESFVVQGLRMILRELEFCGVQSVGGLR